MNKRRWTTVSLSRKQTCFLDKISKNARFSGGRKLSRTSMITAFLKAAKTLDVDVSSVRTENQLKERFLVSFR